MTAPFRLTPTPQPGESGRFHAAKSRSTLAVIDAVGVNLQAAAATNERVIKMTIEALDWVRMSISDDAVSNRYACRKAWITSMNYRGPSRSHTISGLTHPRHYSGTIPIHHMVLSPTSMS